MKYSNLVIVSCLLFSLHCSAQVASYSSLANKFLKSLTEEELKKVRYEFSGNEKYDWHFVPIEERKGIILRELDEQQKQAAFDLLKQYLSDKSFRQTQEIIQLELVLKELENRPKADMYRDPDNYSFIFFGTPSDTTHWGWRFEGHHISFTFSTVNNKIVSGTPGFLGANPAIVLSGPQKGKEILKDESELGFSLMQMLTQEQLSKTLIVSEVPSEIITSNARRAMIENPTGIFYKDLNKEQQKIFLQLLSVYINRYTKRFADVMMHEIEEAGLEKLQFAWAGDVHRDIGKPYYYRIQGPTVIIELDNTQNNANHVHTVVRDLLHDFGDDELLDHYQKSHAKNQDN